VKSFRIIGGRTAACKEYASFCMQCMLLQQNLYTVTRIRDSIIIAGWENRVLADWAAITSDTLVREVMATRKSHAPGLAYWLGMLYPPPPGKERPGSWSRDPAKGKGPEVPAPEPIWEIGLSGLSPASEHIPEVASVEE
jgi:hypothetical protein